MTTMDKLKGMILDALDEVREDFDPGEYLEDEEMLDTYINDVKLRINNILYDIKSCKDTTKRATQIFAVLYKIGKGICTIIDGRNNAFDCLNSNRWKDIGPCLLSYIK